MSDEHRWNVERRFCEHGRQATHPVSLIVERSWCPGPVVPVDSTEEKR